MRVHTDAVSNSARPIAHRWHVRPLEVVYVVAVGGVMAAATSGSDPQDRVHLFQLALALSLPAMIAGLPFLYVAGAAAWGMTDVDPGGPLWTITFVYTLVTVLVAIGNVMLLRWFMARRADRHRS
ncbi:MAG: hypothetical protein RJA49_811 [Actinomycetota bacterium]|jgi:hypothetical protein